MLDSATRLFSRNGYRGTSMDDVARAAPVSKATIYSHFQDKDALFRAVMSHVAERITARTLAAAAAPGTFATRLRGMLEASVVAVFEIGPASPHMFELIEANARLGDNALHRMKQRAAEAMAALIDSAAATGEISLASTGLAARDIAALLSRSAHGAAASAASKEELGRTLDDLVRLALAAVRTQ